MALLLDYYYDYYSLYLQREKNESGNWPSIQILLFANIHKSFVFISRERWTAFYYLYIIVIRPRWNHPIRIIIIPRRFHNKSFVPFIVLNLRNVLNRIKIFNLKTPLFIISYDCIKSVGFDRIIMNSLIILRSVDSNFMNSN